MGDKKKISIFTIIFLGVFIAMGVLALILFSLTGKNRSSSATSSTVVMWGFVSPDTFSLVQQSLGAQKPAIDLKYTQKDPLVFERDLVNALASGDGPDLVMLTDDMIIRHEGKFVKLPYDAVSRSEFLSAFVDGAEVFALPHGIVGHPFSVDPMVMYYNRDHLASNFLLEPPSSWQQVLDVTPQLRRFDSADESLVRSSIAMGGDSTNMLHAKDVFSLLVRQTGNPLVRSYLGTDKDGEDATLYQSTITSPSNDIPVLDIANFYTSFTDSRQPHYSWNGSFRVDQEAFAAGELTLYIGYASEFPEIVGLNPNLNFDITFVPQLDDPQRLVTLGRFTSLAVPRASANQSGALRAASLLSSDDFYENMAIYNTSLVPVRRALYTTQRPADVQRSRIWDSGIISHSWYDPDRDRTDELFDAMIRDIRTGAQRPDAAVSGYHSDLDFILGQGFGAL